MTHGELIVEAADDRWVSAEMRAARDRWKHLAGDRLAPAWGEFALADLPTRILPWSVVVNVIPGDGGADFIYRYWGGERIRLLGQDMTGKPVRELPVMPATVYQQYMEVLQQRRPLYFSHEHQVEGGLRPCFESLRLPLSSDGETIDMIYAVTRFTELTAGHYDVFGNQGPLVGNEIGGIDGR